MATDFARTPNPPLIVERDGVPIFDVLEKSRRTVDQKDDTDWVKSAFLLSDEDLEYELDKMNRYWSSSAAKFTDTRLGANIGINPRPQFTRYCDIRSKGRLTGRNDVTVTSTSGNYGMGRAYSQNIDDPAQTIYMTFGVPQYNSITNFLKWAFDTEMSSLARTGHGSNRFFKFLSVVGHIGMALAFPVLAITVYATKEIVTRFISPTTRYYSMKETMHMYWGTVNSLVNAMAVNRGIFPKIFTGKEEDQSMGKPYKLDEQSMAELHGLMPDVFSPSGYFDMYAMSGKGQRIATAVQEEERKVLESGSAQSYLGYVSERSRLDLQGKIEIPHEGNPLGGIGRSLSEAVGEIQNLRYYSASDNEDIRSAVDIILDEESGGDAVLNEPAQKDGFFEHVKNNYRDGAKYATFKVNYTGTVQESFSNSVTESDISQKLNSESSKLKEARFSFMDGNVAGDAVNTALKATAAVIGEAINIATFGIFDAIKGLAGSGYIEIPKHWQSSSASLSRTTYTMDLVSPYGNPISQLINIDIPLAMLLAGALPLSTGKQSYTSPFLCSIYDRGRAQVRLGMIESLSIERGTTNLGFNLEGKAMGIKVSFSVVDLSNIMHMPVSTGEFFKADSLMDDGNILVDYLAVLTGQDLHSQTYFMPKAKIALSNWINKTKRLTSSSYYASKFHGYMQGSVIGAPLNGIFHFMASTSDIAKGAEAGLR